MSKWLTFSEPMASKSGKTSIWALYSGKDDSDLWIGEIKWFSRWRRYAFFPDRDTIYEQDCLRDIAQFCEDKTREHKKR